MDTNSYMYFLLNSRKPNTIGFALVDPVYTDGASLHVMT